ncbi:MAG: M14 family metallopeptidase [Thermoanaerobaculia bacterium]|nr:M14 family metallopeptidase [Thermoanaerobaculia bacterium]
MPTRLFTLALLAFLFLPVIARAEGAAETAVLPPELPWTGQSRALVAAAGDPWITPAEASGLTTTPSYDETVAWLRRLVAAAPELEMVSLGKSWEGRDVWMVIASSDRAFSPGALARTGKAIVLAQAGIHAGEIDGKDAGLMLLRDLTVGGSKRALLDKAAFLFVPILNVDGHERASRWARMNQRGPERMGWRTNARNLNLNRDYAKLDTPELRAVIAAINAWQPDVYVDLHVTDGVDYQYDITWGATGPHAWSPKIAGWLEDVLRPALDRDLEAMGHVPGRLVFPIDATDVGKGLWDWTATPRFSDGYGSARHLPTILVENHSLKPYPQRVLGTYVWLASCSATWVIAAPSCAPRSTTIGASAPRCCR